MSLELFLVGISPKYLINFVGLEKPYKLLHSLVITVIVLDDTPGIVLSSQLKS